MQKQRKAQKRVKLSTPYPIFTPLATRMESMQLSSPLKTPERAANRFISTQRQLSAQNQIASAFDHVKMDSGDKSMDGGFK